MMDRMRFGGLGSGIDTHEMVSQLMRVERMRVDRFVQQEKRTQWRQEAIHEANRKMANFVLDMRRGFGLNQVSYSGQFRATDVSQFNWVKSARSSSAETVSATANASAMNGTHKVKVTQLAEVATATSLDLKTARVGDEHSPLLLEAGSNRFSTAAEGKTISFKLGTSDEVKTFEITEGATVNDLVRFMNSDAGKNGQVSLNAAYDADLGRLMVATRQTGLDQQFSFVEHGPEDITSQVFAIETAEGRNAEIEFNGTAVEKSTNTFDVFGINLTLKELGEANITVATDVDSVVDKIKDFVNQYNEMLDDLSGRLGETFYKDYAPLTDEQKQTMTDRDIEQWEERSRSGLLRNDETISRMLQQLRTGLYEPVEGITGSYSQLTQIGITTGNFRDGGKLVIDEDKLRNAISNDADGVMNLMFKTTSSTDETTRRKESGLIQRLNDDIVRGMQEMVRIGGTGEDGSLYRSVQGNMLVDFVTRNSSISLLQREMSTLNQRIAREEQALLRKEEAYWSRFTAMEKAMGEMANQSNWLMAQLGQS